MGRLTTHILDTARGTPAAGVAIRLFALGDQRALCRSATTNADGRTETPLLEGDALKSATYELEFDIGDYFGKDTSGDSGGSAPFLGTVVIRVTLNADENYHVPLLASPWSYSTYRGS